MDLLQTVRKEGSRGGVNFSWDDVKNSQHRENYLGHSLMAPVGRWQKNKDLGWYAKADDEELTREQKAERQREEKRAELKKVKEAEEAAMAKALGLPIPERSNANEEPLNLSRDRREEMNQALNEVLGDRDSHKRDSQDRGRERTERSGWSANEGHRRSRTDRDERHWSTKPRRRRSRSRSPDFRKERRHRHQDNERSRPRSRSRDRRRRSTSRGRVRDEAHHHGDHYERSERQRGRRDVYRDDQAGRQYRRDPSRSRYSREGRTSSYDR